VDFGTLDIWYTGWYTTPAGTFEWFFWYTRIVIGHVQYVWYSLINNNTPRQCLWCCHHGRAIARVQPVHLVNIVRRQAAADPRPSQTTYVSPPVHAARINTHHRHLLLLLSPQVDTHFTAPQSVEGWLVKYRDGLPVHRRSSILVLTGSDVAQLR